MGVETTYFVVLFMRTKLGSGALFDKLQNSFTKQHPHPPPLVAAFSELFTFLGNKNIPQSFQTVGPDGKMKTSPICSKVAKNVDTPVFSLNVKLFTLPKQFS